MTQSLTEKARKALDESYVAFDTDGSGYIELHELGLLLSKLADSFHVEQPDPSEVK